VTFQTVLDNDLKILRKSSQLHHIKRCTVRVEGQGRLTAALNHNTTKQICYDSALQRKVRLQTVLTQAAQMF